MTGRWDPIGPVNAFSGLEPCLGGKAFLGQQRRKTNGSGVENSVVELDGLPDNYNGVVRAVPLRKKELLHYLWLDDSYFKAVDSLPWRSDETLHQAIRRFHGLRILRQPLKQQWFFCSVRPRAFLKLKNCVPRLINYWVMN